MPNLAYLECPTGIAGDMCLGALVHMGVPLDYLIEQLGRLGIADECKLWAELVLRNGQQATKVHVDLLRNATGHEPHTFSDPLPSRPGHSLNHRADVDLSHDHPHPHSPDPSEHSHLHHPDHPHTPHTHHSPDPHSHTSSHHPEHWHGERHLPEIEQMIQTAGLPARARDWSLAIFRRLAEAEGAVHGVSPDQVHFHEVGAVDAIVDIVGTCLGLDWLDIDQLYCSALPVGGGTIRAAHGLLPVPPPAVLKLWEMRQIPVYSNGIHRELVTPTGAAIATTLATDFGDPPPMRLHRVGLGAGSRDFPIPNILRLWLGTTEGHSPSQPQQATVPTPVPAQPTQTPPTAQTVTLLETQVDDLNPQAIGYLFDALLAAGALDVFTQPVGMKKSRPGTLLTVICQPEHIQTCQTLLFQETTTLGIRQTQQQRTILHREFETVETPYGPVTVKIARRHPNEPILNVQPEYEDCARLARQHKQPWREVHQLALAIWHQHHSKQGTSAP